MEDLSREEPGIKTSSHMPALVVIDTSGNKKEKQPRT